MVPVTNMRYEVNLIGEYLNLVFVIKQLKCDNCMILAVLAFCGQHVRDKRYARLLILNFTFVSQRWRLKEG